MAKWQPSPDEPVNVQERVGRRLFDEPILNGTSGQKAYAGIKLTHFQERRGPNVSVDRLGRTGIEPKVIGFLRPLCGNAATNFQTPLSFDGWAVVKVAEITSPRLKWCQSSDVLPSPIKEPPDEVNPYHAHIVRPRDLDENMYALILRHIFVTYGEICRP